MVTGKDFRSQFDRFGAKEHIDFESGGDCASIKFEIEEAAWKAVKLFFTETIQKKIKNYSSDS